MLFRSYETLLTGRVIHVDSLPSASVARQKPAYRDTLIMVGNDPVDVYFFHPYFQDFVLLCRSSLGSYAYSPSPATRLSPPTISPSSGNRGAVTITHSDPLATVYYAVGDYNNFVPLTDPSGKVTIPADGKHAWVAAYAMRAGYLDSVTIRKFFTTV